MQARLSPAYVAKVREKQKQARVQIPAFTVLQPRKPITDLHVGQLILVSLPTSAGVPQSVSIGDHHCSLNAAIEHQGNQDMQSRYIICLPLMPEVPQHHCLTLHCKREDQLQPISTKRLFSLLG